MGNPVGGKGGGSSPPPPPDPSSVANAQAQANITAGQAQQNLNAVNQNTPWGSINYYRDPTTGQMVQNTSLNPNQQFQLGAQQLQGGLLSGMSLQDLGNVKNALGQGLNFNQLPASVTGVQGAPIQGSVQNNANQFQTSLAPTSLGIQQMAPGSLGNVSGGSAFNFNTSNLPNLNQNYGQQFDETQQAVLKAQMPVLNQLQEQQQRELTDKLAGQGIAQGSDAYNREMQLLSQNQGQNYNSLAAQAYGQGLQTQGQLFGEQLGSRQQLFGEQATQAQNQIAAQQISEAASAANAQNQLAMYGLNNAAQAQQFGQGLAGGEFTNQALGQQFGQNLQAGVYGLGAQQQGFGQGMQNAGLQNAARQNALQEQMLASQYPIQQFAQLQGLAGNVGMPSMPSFPTATVGSPQIADYMAQAYGAQQNAYNQQIASQNSKNSGLMNMGATLGSAYLSS